MKLFCAASSVLVLLVVLTAPVVMGACGSRPGSSPEVPKPTIEKAADTKIADAGSDDAGERAAH